MIGRTLFATFMLKGCLLQSVLKQRVFLGALVLVFGLSFQGLYANQADTLEHEIEQFADGFEKILSEVVVQQTFESAYGRFAHNAVDYKKLVSDPALRKIMDREVSRLAGWKAPPPLKKQNLAFLINVYNFYTLKAVVDEYPVQSMKDIGWKNKNIEIGGRKFSLDEIEHKIIRPFGDPRIHFAINCASVSCPTLLAVSYRQTTLDRDLEERVRKSLLSPLHLRKEEKSFLSSEKLLVSRIFKWFKVDFEQGQTLKGYILGYLPDKLLVELASDTDSAAKKAADVNVKKLEQGLKVSYMAYNWNLNTVKNIKAYVEELKEEDVKIVPVR